MSSATSATLAHIHELEERAKKEPTLENYRKLLQERLAYLQEHPEMLSNTSDLKSSIIFEELESESSIQFECVSPTSSTPHKAKMKLTSESVTSVVSNENTDAKEHLFLYFQVLKKCAKRISLLDQYMTKPYNCPKEYIEFVGELLDSWMAFIGTIEEDLRHLKSYEGQHPGVLPPMDFLLNTVDKMCRAQLSSRSFIGHERHRHVMCSSVSIEVLVDYCASIEQFLSYAGQRQQQSLTSFRDCEGFVSYLSRHKSKVEDGLLAISSQASQLKVLNSAVEVREKLQACFRLWTDLCWSTFCRVQSELVNFHEDMEVAERCEIFESTEGPIIEQFLTESVPDILQQLNLSKEDETKLGKGEELLELHHTVVVLANHLSTFKVRAAAVNNVVECLGRAVCSPPSYFLMQLPAWDENEVLEEFEQQFSELQEWVEVHLQSQTFLRLLEGTNAMRSILQDYKSTLINSAAPKVDEG